MGRWAASAIASFVPKSEMESQDTFSGRPNRRQSETLKDGPGIATSKKRGNGNAELEAAPNAFRYLPLWSNVGRKWIRLRSFWKLRKSLRKWNTDRSSAPGKCLNGVVGRNFHVLEASQTGQPVQIDAPSPDFFGTSPGSSATDSLLSWPCPCPLLGICAFFSPPWQPTNVLFPTLLHRETVIFLLDTESGTRRFERCSTQVTAQVPSRRKAWQATADQSTGHGHISCTENSARRDHGNNGAGWLQRKISDDRVSDSNSPLSLLPSEDVQRDRCVSSMHVERRM